MDRTYTWSTRFAEDRMPAPGDLRGGFFIAPGAPRGRGRFAPEAASPTAQPRPLPTWKQARGHCHRPCGGSCGFSVSGPGGLRLEMANDQLQFRQRKVAGDDLLAVVVGLGDHQVADQERALLPIVHFVSSFSPILHDRPPHCPGPSLSGSFRGRSQGLSFIMDQIRAEGPTGQVVATSIDGNTYATAAGDPFAARGDERFHMADGSVGTLIGAVVFVQNEAGEQVPAYWLEPVPDSLE